MTEISYILTKDEAKKLSFILAKSKEKKLNEDEVAQVKGILHEQYPWVKDLNVQELIKLGLIVIGLNYIVTSLIPEILKPRRRKRLRR